MIDQKKPNFRKDNSISYLSIKPTGPVLSIPITMNSDIWVDDRPNMVNDDKQETTDQSQTRLSEKNDIDDRLL